MNWKLVKALGIVGSLVVASGVVIGKIIIEACKPEPYKKKETEHPHGRYDSGRIHRDEL